MFELPQSRMWFLREWKNQNKSLHRPKNARLQIASKILIHISILTSWSHKENGECKYQSSEFRFAVSRRWTKWKKKWLKSHQILWATSCINGKLQHSNFFSKFAPQYIPMYYFQNRFVYSFRILNHTALHLINEVYSLLPPKKYIKNKSCPKLYFVDFNTMLYVGLLYSISGLNSRFFWTLYFSSGVGRENR